ncbi:MAG: Ig-like domain-containing protein [Prevotella sp.]|nr:Ig-like domain-containing protein [Staphylococcus sp.]MCM1350856.1 Ig-like domain-containing protein [Prevotella sp.]
MKKIYITIISIAIITFFGIKINDSVLAKSEKTINDEKFIIQVLNNDNTEVDLSDVKIEVYNANPVYNNGELLYYTHELCNIYTNINNEIIIDRPSELLLLKIDLDTLPEGYGVKQTQIFVTTEIRKSVFYINEIADLSLYQDEDNQFNVKFMNVEKERIYAPYQIVSENQDVEATNIQVKNQSITYEVAIEEKTTMGLDINHSFLCGNITQVKSALSLPVQELNGDVEKPTYYQTSYSNVSYVFSPNRKFKIYYDVEKMIKDNIEDVAHVVEDVQNYFCDENQWGFQVPKTSDSFGYYEIIIEYDDIVSQNYDFSIGGYAQQVGECSYIVMNYNFMEYNTQDFKSNCFEYIFAHEYFHSIQFNTMKGIYINEHWYYESMANFASCCYINQKSINNKDEYGNMQENVYAWGQMYRDLKAYWQNTTTSIDDYESVHRREYETFCFWLYIYDQFGLQCIKDIMSSYCNEKEKFEILDRVLHNYQTSADELFRQYCIAMSFMDDQFLEIIDEYKNSWDRKENEKNEIIENLYYSNKLKEMEITLPYYSSYYQHFETKNWSDCNLFLTFNIDNYDPIVLAQCYQNKDGELIRNEIVPNGQLITIVKNNKSDDVDNRIVFMVENYKKASQKVKIRYSVTYEHIMQDIEENQPVNMKEHLHWSSGRNDVSYRFIPKESGVYTFSFQIIKNGIKKQDITPSFIKILNKYLEPMKKYDGDLAELDASNVINSHQIVVSLQAGESYYVSLKGYNWLQNYNTIELYVTKNLETILVDDVNINEYIQYETNVCEKMYKLDNKHVGYYHFQIHMDENQDASNMVVVLLSMYNDTIRVQYETKLNQSCFAEFEMALNQNATYYIGYYGANKNTIMDFSMHRVVEKEDVLYTDLNENVTVGSEVRLNQGVYRGTNITSGYTRVLYTWNQDDSRLNYYWYSLDEEKAKVSAYGTVTAMPVTEVSQVKIIAVSKFNVKEIRSITLTIFPDTTSGIKEVQLTTDERISGPICGTEVSQNGGSPKEITIHSGFTRLICFKKNHPTDSIQDFIWTSSDDSIATVSSYGTILAKDKKGTVIIAGVYKYNSNFVAMIEIKVI